MKERKMIPRLILTVLLFALVSCSQDAFRQVASPTARVISVDLVERTEEGARFMVTVELKNPNDLSLPLVDAQYVVSVAKHIGVPFRRNPNRTLPAKGKQIVELPAAIALSKTDLKNARYAVSGSITYNPPGEIRQLLTESQIPLPTVSFSATGKFE